MEKEQPKLMSKEEMLKNVKENYKKHRITYKQFMVDTKRIEKHYDEWEKEFNEEINKNNPTQPVTNETETDKTNE